MKIIRLAIIAGALTSVAAVAVAQNVPPAPQADQARTEAVNKDQPRRGGRMARLDANKDGVIDQQEFSSVKHLKEADANNDGTLGSDELLAWIEKREAERKVQRLTRQLDVDGDGIVTLAEIENQKAKRFALMDRNNDGKLEGRELRGNPHGKAMKERHSERRWKQDGRRGNHGEHRGRHHDRGYDAPPIQPDRT